MQFSILDVVLVAIFLTAAIVGGALGVLSKELVAAIITAAVAFLAARGKALFDKNKASEKKADDQRAEDKADAKQEQQDADEKKADEEKAADDAAVPDKPLEPTTSHSNKITITPNGTVTIERLFEDEAQEIREGGEKDKVVEEPPPRDANGLGD